MVLVLHVNATAENSSLTLLYVSPHFIPMHFFFPSLAIFEEGYTFRCRSLPGMRPENMSATIQHQAQDDRPKKEYNIDVENPQ